jgi:hypothetical protein
LGSRKIRTNRFATARAQREALLRYSEGTFQTLGRGAELNAVSRRVVNYGDKLGLEWHKMFLGIEPDGYSKNAFIFTECQSYHLSVRNRLLAIYSAWLPNKSERETFLQLKFSGLFITCSNDVLAGCSLGGDYRGTAVRAPNGACGDDHVIASLEPIALRCFRSS